MKRLVTVIKPNQNPLREIMLKRIYEMRLRENGFTNKNRYGEFSTGSVKADASEIKWEELSDYDLVLLFERLVRRYNMQM